VAKTSHKETRAGVWSRGVTGAAPGDQGSWKRLRLLNIRDVSLFTEVIGHGYPLVLMHGGPSADQFTLLLFRQLADRFTLVFHDHRHEPYSEQPAEVMAAITDFISADAAAAGPTASRPHRSAKRSRKLTAAHKHELHPDGQSSTSSRTCSRRQTAAH
jgi:hypothetical protein